MEFISFFIVIYPVLKVFNSAFVVKSFLIFVISPSMPVTFVYNASTDDVERESFVTKVD